MPVEIVHQDAHSDGWIETDFARQLGRELNTAQARVRELEEWASSLRGGSIDPGRELWSYVGPAKPEGLK